MRPREKHSKGEESEDGPAEDAEDSEPGLDQTGDVLHHEDQRVAEQA